MEVRSLLSSSHGGGARVGCQGKAVIVLGLCAIGTPEGPCL
jgi:hypothetical protein